jgi:hypothetical protein
MTFSKKFETPQQQKFLSIDGRKLISRFREFSKRESVGGRRGMALTVTSHEHNPRF